MVNNGLDTDVVDTVAVRLREEHAFPANLTNITVKRSTDGMMEINPVPTGVPLVKGQAKFTYNTIDLAQITKQWGSIRIPQVTYRSAQEMIDAILTYNAIKVEETDITWPAFPYKPIKAQPFKWVAPATSLRFTGSTVINFFLPSRAVIDFTLHNSRAVTVGNYIGVASTYSQPTPDPKEYTVDINGEIYTDADLEISNYGSGYRVVRAKVRTEIPVGSVRIRIDSAYPLGTGYNRMEGGISDNLTNILTNQVIRIDEITQNGVANGYLGFIDPATSGPDCVINPKAFANNEISVNISFLFANARIKTIPDGLFDGLSITGARGVFQQSGVTKIPKGLFAKCKALNGSFQNFIRGSKVATWESGVWPQTTTIENFQGLAQDCKDLKTIPSDIFRHAKATITTIQSAFDGSGLETIPGDMLDGMTALLYVSNVFKSSQLTTIPDGLFANCPKAAYLDYCFYATKVSTIPPTLFDNLPDLAMTSYMFSRTKVTEIPQMLFANKTKLNFISSMFQGCTDLVTVPKELFKTAQNVTQMTSFLDGCTMVYPFPMDLFQWSKSVTQMSFVCDNVGRVAYQERGEKLTLTKEFLVNCSRVERMDRAFIAMQFDVIEEGAFDTLTSVKSMSNLFGGGSWSPAGSPLVSIPETLFAKCRSLTTIDGIFAFALIDAVPPNLFQLMPKKASVGSVEGIFYNCVNLKTVPVGLFTGFTSVTSVESLFAGYRGETPLFRSGLTSLPDGFFTNFGSTITNAAGVFMGTSITRATKAMVKGLEATTKLDEMFKECILMTTVEDGLFVGFTAATSALRTFQQCGALTNITAPLMVPTDSKITITTSIFHDCVSLTIPMSLSRGLSTQLRNVEYSYAGCKGLVEIPANMIEGTTTLGVAKGMFKDCTGLKFVRTGAFDVKSSIYRPDFTSLLEGSLALDGILEPECFTLYDNYIFTNVLSQTQQFGGYRGTVENLQKAFKLATDRPSPTMLNLCCKTNQSGWSNDGISGNTKPFMEAMGLPVGNYRSVFGNSPDITSV